MMETMIPPQVGMKLRTELKKGRKIKEAKEAQNKKEAKEAQKMREKERRDNVTILFPHLLREPWTRGCPDSRTIIIGRTPRL